MTTSSRKTTNHEVINFWTEDRGGVPAAVSATQTGDDTGLLRIHFEGHGGGDDLDRVSWEDFFAEFEEAKLAFVYEVHTSDGPLCRFSRLVSR